MAEEKKITKKSQSNRLIRFAKRKVTQKMDSKIGRALFGNTAGLQNNIKGKVSLMKAGSSIKSTAAQELINNGYYPLGTPFDKSLIQELKSKVNQMMEDDEYSFVRTEYKGKVYSRGIYHAHENFPEVGKLLTPEILKIVNECFNGKFKVRGFFLWRNYHVPPDIVSETETFSDRWHCDGRPVDIYKLFVNLSDVTEDDGPFHIQSRQRTKELIKRGFSGRGNHNLPDDVVNDPKYVLKAIGTAGTTLLCNTELCLHRAGIPAPNHSRDIIEFKFITSNKPFSENWMEHLDVDELEERMSGKE